MPFQENAQENFASYGSAQAAGNELAKEAKVSPPMPPRSAFMCFSDDKRKEFEGQGTSKKQMIGRVAEAWKSLSERERAVWDEAEREDRIRFEREKAGYRGQWDLKKRRAKKNPLAPKRPPSAFLRYSQSHRKLVKKENPNIKNTDISRLLGEMWRNASDREKSPFIEQELRERAIFHKNTAKFREEQARVDAASRTSHQNVQQMSNHPPPHAYDNIQSRPDEVISRSAAIMRGYAGHHAEIDAVGSSDSASFSDFRWYPTDHYGAQYSSTGHPAGGPGK